MEIEEVVKERIFEEFRDLFRGIKKPKVKIRDFWIESERATEQVMFSKEGEEKGGLIIYPINTGRVRASVEIEKVVLGIPIEAKFSLEIGHRGAYYFEDFEIANRDEAIADQTFSLLIKCDCCERKFPIKVSFSSWRDREIDWLGGKEISLDFRPARAKIQEINWKKKDRIIQESFKERIEILSFRAFEAQKRKILQLNQYLKGGPSLKNIGIRTFRHGSCSKTLDVCNQCRAEFHPEMSLEEVMRVVPKLKISGEYQEYLEKIKKEKVRYYLMRG